jgi:hypothetical protein
MAAVALLVGACSGPSDKAGGDTPVLALARSGRTIEPRAIKPAVTPLGLDNKPVKVVVEVAGDPITVVQALTPER